MTGSVLVTGPRSAGVTCLASALRARLPGVTVAEDDPAPAVLVFAVSAAAPMTESDYALLRRAAGSSVPVIAVVTKTDAHLDWPTVLATDRALVAREYPDLPWVGAAAGSGAGDPRIDELVEHLDRYLAGPAPGRRPVPAVRDARRTAALRTRIQRARVGLTYDARNRCAALRTELHDELADVGRHRVERFPAHVRHRAAEVFAELDGQVSAMLTGVAADIGLSPPVLVPAPPPVLAAPALRSRRLENRLVMLLGAGFGLGVALAVSRLFSGLDPELTVAGLFAGGLAGLAVTVWMVGIRGLLHDRAALDRWVAEACAVLRSAAEERVALRVLDAESAWTYDALEERRKQFFGRPGEFAACERRVTDQ